MHNSCLHGQQLFSQTSENTVANLLQMLLQSVGIVFVKYLVYISQLNENGAVCDIATKEMH